MKKIFFETKFLLLLLSILLISIALSRPTLELEQPTYRYVFTFDISQSMNVNDVPNTDGSISRLDYAKQMVLETISSLPCGTEVGLALFTGNRAFMLIKPVEICSNHVELTSVVEDVNWKMTWKANSEIAKGLFKNIRLLSYLDTETRLVFFTDGHESPPINLKLPPRFPGKVGEVSGLIVGVGGEELVQIPKFDKQTGEREGFWKENEVKHTDVYTATSAGENEVITGTEHLSSLKEKYLQGLAEKTGLIYHRMKSSKQLLEQVRSKSLSLPQTVTTDISWLFALGAIVALLAMFLIDPVRAYFRRA